MGCHRSIFTLQHLSRVLDDDGPAGPVSIAGEAGATSRLLDRAFSEALIRATHGLGRFSVWTKRVHAVDLLDDVLIWIHDILGS
jgi:hypothetical protein